jgi:hypothetical protein
MIARVAVSIALACVVSACAASQRAAAKDPQRCERDPECAAKQGKYRDCTSQCVDNIECMERCEQIRRQVSP